jgi:hypothetical protein
MLSIGANKAPVARQIVGHLPHTSTLSLCLGSSQLNVMEALNNE